MKFARFLGMACVIAAGFLPATAGAQAQYPDRPVKLIVPYAPGGTVDAFARVLQPTFEAQLGKPVVIENLAGAGGMIGIRTLIKAKPDGYTIGLGIVSDVVLAPLTEAAAGYTYKELEAVAPLGTSGLGIVAKPGLGIKSIDDLIAYARKNPGKLSNGSTGAGSLPAIAMEDLKRRANIDLQFVPHTSASKIAQGALGGHIDIVASGLPALLEFIKSDRLSGVGVLSTEPDLGNSDLQSAGAVKELAGMDFYFWTGLFAPKGTPPAIVEKLNAAFRAALRDPAIETRFKEFGVRFRQNGHAIEVRTKGEVILCAGSIGST